MTTETRDDLFIYGYAAVGAYLKISPRAAKHLGLGGWFATERLGRVVRVRVSDLAPWKGRAQEARPKKKMPAGPKRKRPQHGRVHTPTKAL